MKKAVQVSTLEFVDAVGIVELLLTEVPYCYRNYLEHRPGHTAAGMDDGTHCKAVHLYDHQLVPSNGLGTLMLDGMALLPDNSDTAGKDFHLACYVHKLAPRRLLKSNIKNETEFY